MHPINYHDNQRSIVFLQHMPVALLELPYLPEINWFRNFLKYKTIWIEREQNFSKSSHLNRCEIAGANGKQILSIPIVGGRDHHQKYKETKTSFATNWQSSHWQSIRSAYGSAPFFEFYADRFEPFYQNKPDLLFDFNLDLLQEVLQMLKIDKPILLTSDYTNTPPDKIDLRAKNNWQLKADMPRYYQVFEERKGFIPNLSIIDLIFNLGPAAKDYLSS